MRKGDVVIWVVVINPFAFSSYLRFTVQRERWPYKKQGGNTEYYLFKHFVIMGFGIMLMYAIHLVKYTYFSRISQIGLILKIPLLFITLLSGTNLNEANRLAYGTHHQSHLSKFRCSQGFPDYVPGTCAE